MRFAQLFRESKLCTVKSGEIVLNGLGPSDQLPAAVRLEEDLGGAQLAVVVVAHGKAVGAGVVNAHNVADFDFR